MPDGLIQKLYMLFGTIQDDGSFFLNKNKNSHAVLTRGDTPTSGEGIALVSLLAAAHRVMHDHCALRPRGTRARTGVPALLINAGPVAGTLGVDQALGSAVGRNAHVAGQAGAGRDTVRVAALRIAAARVGPAGVGGSGRFCDHSLSCH